MLIKLYIGVNGVEDVMRLYTHVQVHRATAVAGTYAEITAAATRPKLEPGVSTYTYFDTTGTATSWYKTRYYNAVDGALSSFSDPQLGDDSESLTGIMTVEELKSIYLFGIDRTDDYGNPFPDIMYDFGIRAAISWLEAELNLDLRPIDRTERYDYEQRTFQEWGFIQLDHYPCREWDSANHYVKMYWPSASSAYTFPQDWIRLEKMAGQINLVPTSGSLAAAMIVEGAVLPTVLSRVPYVPRAIEVKYTSGFEYGTVPHNIRSIIGMRASYPVLNTAGDLIAGAGIANYSLSVDGLSQSVGTTSSATNAGYGSRLLRYGKEIKDQLASAKRYWKNVGMAVI